MQLIWFLQSLGEFGGIRTAALDLLESIGLEGTQCSAVERAQNVESDSRVLCPDSTIYYFICKVGLLPTSKGYFEAKLSERT